MLRKIRRKEREKCQFVTNSCGLETRGWFERSVFEERIEDDRRNENLLLCV